MALNSIEAILDIVDPMFWAAASQEEKQRMAVLVRRMQGMNPDEELRLRNLEAMLEFPGPILWPDAATYRKGA